jgi:hypothetical protein
MNTKKEHIAFAIVLSTLMSGVMSLAVTFFNLGFVSGFAWLWLKAWLFSLIIAMPATMLLSPVAQKLVDRLYR